MRKIDIHCHATNRRLSHTVSPVADLEAISKEMAKYDIRQTVVLASYFPASTKDSNKGTGISNFRMKSWVDRHRMNSLPGSTTLQTWARPCDSQFLMFGSLDFERYFYQGMNELEELAETDGISGVKIYSGYQTVPLSELEEVLKLCLKFHIPIMFHTGDCAGSRGHFSITSLDPLVEKYSDVNFIYTHLCNPNMNGVIERVKRYTNIYTDMSGLIHSGKDDHEIPQAIENLKRFYGECGTSRLMFGTDFPVQTHEHSVLIASKSIGVVANADEQYNFWYENAATLLKI